MLSVARWRLWRLKVLVVALRLVGWKQQIQRWVSLRTGLRFEEIVMVWEPVMGSLWP